MSDGEEKGKRRRAVFTNIANGIPLSDVMEAFKMSQLEVEQDLRHVLRRIREYRHERAAKGGTKQSPFVSLIIPTETHSDIIMHRKSMLFTLSRIGNVTLSSEIFLYKRITSQSITPKEAADVRHRITSI